MVGGGVRRMFPFGFGLFFKKKNIIQHVTYEMIL